MVPLADQFGEQSRKLDCLFEEWRKSYPKTCQADFFKDGIVDEGCYFQEATRILYIVLEPNSANRKCAQSYESDLRRRWCHLTSTDSFRRNLARWTGVLLDGETQYSAIDAKTARKRLRRVAVMNLKKLGGSATADTEAISLHAWRDREFIRQQVAIVNPTLVVACGKTANRLFWWILEDDFLKGPPRESSLWRCDRFRVLPANHPSFRPKDPHSAFGRFVTLARQGKVGRFARRY